MQHRSNYIRAAKVFISLGFSIGCWFSDMVEIVDDIIKTLGLLTKAIQVESDLMANIINQLEGYNYFLEYHMFLPWVYHKIYHEFILACCKQEKRCTTKIVLELGENYFFLSKYFYLGINSDSVYIYSIYERVHYQLKIDFGNL